MALAFWKRIELSAGYQQTKTTLRRLIGHELRLHVEIPVTTIRVGGWWFCPEKLNRDSIIYSLGVGDDISFDLAVIERYGAKIHSFDPTPSSVDMLANTDLPDGFCFHPWAITAQDRTLKLYPRVRKDGSRSEMMYTMIAEDASSESAIEVPAYSLSSIMARLGHDCIDLLKMDIEGSEYEVLESMLDSSIRPGQLLVEFHHRFPTIKLGATANIIKRLHQAGYKIFAITETGREVSFLQAS